MTGAQIQQPALPKPLRVWPGVAIVILQWLLRFAVPVVVPGAMIVGVLAGALGGIAVLLWWLLFSRAPWSERLGGIGLMIVALYATKPILDKSIATGAQGFLFLFLAIPTLSLAFVAWAVATRRLPNGPRRVSMVAVILAGCGMWALARTGGFTGSFQNDLHWRWAATPEERLLATTTHEPAPLPPAPVASTAPATPAAPVTPAAPEAGRSAPAAAPAAPAAHAPVAAAPVASETGAGWPGFRGPHRDDVIAGVRIVTDWSQKPPVELWRRPVGPGWSSFAVHGNLIYTEEQRGPDEVVACYEATTGKPVWAHRDPVRFWESNGGAGPRATPTFNNGRVYTFGATGILNALDAATGAVVWSRSAASDTHTKVPGWGFASSPLVLGDTVIIATSGKLAAYDAATGEPRWTGPDGGDSYSSPHLVTIGGVAQIVLMSGHGATGVAPADGKVLWQYAWRADTRIVQPALISDGDLLMSAGTGTGMRRVALAEGPGGWTVQERWSSNGLKPYFNDFVVHEGHAYGFDGSILACIDVTDGKRVWKGGRYGNGQLVLLADQDVLLVLSEEGELALVGAAPDQFKELAHFPAIEGKTWNHPVLAGDELLVRNGQEMAAFRLALARP